jgi:hypothetical protein
MSFIVCFLLRRRFILFLFDVDCVLLVLAPLYSYRSSRVLWRGLRSKLRCTSWPAFWGWITTCTKEPPFTSACSREVSNISTANWQLGAMGNVFAGTEPKLFGSPVLLSQRSRHNGIRVEMELYLSHCKQNEHQIPLQAIDVLNCGPSP